MLADVVIVADPLMQLLTGSIPRRVETGIYDSCGFNFDNFLLDRAVYKYGSDDRSYEDRAFPGLDAYGVCDSIEQWKEHYKALIEHETRKFAVGFTEVLRANQPVEWGWRWHKWGPYIGKHEPKYEYLYDEKEIDRLFTFYAVELRP